MKRERRCSQEPGQTLEVSPQGSMDVKGNAVGCLGRRESNQGEITFREKDNTIKRNPKKQSKGTTARNKSTSSACGRSLGLGKTGGGGGVARGTVGGETPLAVMLWGGVSVTLGRENS